MKKYFRTILISGCMWLTMLVCVGLVNANTSSISVTGANKYIWRGWNLGDDPVLQVGTSTDHSGFALSFWGNYDTEIGAWTEADLTSEYGRSFGYVSLSFGYTYYTFPSLDEGNYSQEIYLGACLSKPFSPTLTVYYDFDEGDGAYIEASASHAVNLSLLALSLDSTLGYNDGQWGANAGFSAATFSISTSVPVGNNLTLYPQITYSLSLDKTFYDNEVVGMVAAEWGF